MNVEARVVNLDQQACDLLILWRLQSDEPLDQAGRSVDVLLDGSLSEVLAVGDFRGELAETVVVYPPKNASAKRVMLVGLGPSEEFGLETMREAAGAAARKANSLRAYEVLMSLPPVGTQTDTVPDLAEAQVVGTCLALYQYPRRSANPPEADTQYVERVTLAADRSNFEQISGSVESGRTIAEAACFVRTWINHPSNVATAPAMESAVVEASARLGMNCSVLDHSELRKQGMGLLLAVGQGAKDAPRMIVLEHLPQNRTDLRAGPVILVGKGVLFDTGGYSLKSRQTMVGMNADMAGSAVVLGVLQAVSGLDLPLHVIALAPIVENLIGPEAYKPNDVFYAKNGKSVEVRSTDAEGRLVLADALCYAETLDPSVVIDIATLTGSKNIALGPRTNALFSSSDFLADSLLRAGKRAGEPLWRMPLDPAYDRQLKSRVADITNSGGRLAGSITAARFLAQFVGDWPWAHIDIAGSSSFGEGPEYTPRSYLSKGGTDIPLRTLVEYLREIPGREGDQLALRSSDNRVKKLNT
jgi:leucyl aminopeptidase